MKSDNLSEFQSYLISKLDRTHRELTDEDVARIAANMKELGYGS